MSFRLNPFTKKFEYPLQDVETSDSPTFAGLTIGTTSAGGNLSVVATEGEELAPTIVAGNWTLGAGWESPIVGGVLNKNADGTGTATPTTPISVIVGASYKITITFSAFTAGGCYGVIGGQFIQTMTSATTYTSYIKAGTTANFYMYGSTTSRFTISSISIKKLSSGSATVGNDLTIYGGQLLIGDGSAGYPGLAFLNDPDTGFRRQNVNAFGIITGGNLYYSFNSGNLELAAANPTIYFYSGSAFDVGLCRDSATGTLGQRYSTTAQTYRLYTTYTSSSNYERLSISTAAGSATIAAESAGATGSANISINLVPKGTGAVKIDHIGEYTGSHGVVFDNAPIATTIKLTDLTDGYLPYHVSDASGLADSVIYTDGTVLNIGATSDPAGGGYKLFITGSTVVDSSIRLRNSGSSSSSMGTFLSFVQDDGANLSVGDRIAALSFIGSYNTGGPYIVSGASIESYAEANWSGSSDHPTYLSFKTSQSGDASRVERVRITGAGVLKVDHMGELNSGHNIIFDNNVGVNAAFGCNSATPQTAYASGGALSAYSAGANGFDTAAHAQEIHTLLTNIRAALVANGIMS